MAKIYKTAMGKQIDLDQIQSRNEHVIAIGNRKVNARGDELGPGGKVVKTRDQLMREYYALNTPVAVDPVTPITPVTPVTPVTTLQPVIPEVVVNPDSGMDEFDTGPVAPVVPQIPVEQIIETASELPIRGSLANSVAQNVTVTQTPKLPPKKANGIQRF